MPFLALIKMVTPEGSEQPPRPRRLFLCGPPPTGDSDGNRADLGTEVERTQGSVPIIVKRSFSRNGGERI